MVEMERWGWTKVRSMRRGYPAFEHADLGLRCQFVEDRSLVVTRKADGAARTLRGSIGHWWPRRLLLDLRNATRVLTETTP